jgi:hypothetical protein
MRTRNARIWLDCAIGGTFLLVIASGLILVAHAQSTVLGLSGHEWGVLHSASSMGLGFGVLAHLLLNGRWIKGVVLSRAKRAKVRWRLWTNVGLLLLFILTLLSAPEGRSLREALFPGPNLLTIHGIAGLAMAGLVLLHMGLRRAWIGSGAPIPHGNPMSPCRE